MAGTSVKATRPLTRCPLCSCNDETQAHLLSRCKHPIMEYWRKDYFRCCKEIIGNNPDKSPKDYLGDLWKWVGQPLVSEVDPEINKDSRRVGLMMGIPIKTDLEEQGQDTNHRMNAGEQKSMHSTMIALQITEATAVKKRKLTESKEVIKDRKERNLQEKAKEKEDKRKAKELQKQAVNNAKKAKAAATAAKAREWKKRRAKPPIEAKKAREGGNQGEQDPGGPRTKQARTCPERDRATAGEGAAIDKASKQPLNKYTTK
jgi:hypothetical protein